MKNLDLKRVKKDRHQIRILIIILCGFAYFFLSKGFLESQEDLLFTPLYETVSLENREISIASWKYSSNEKRMELLLKIDNPLYSNDDVIFSAASRKGNLQTDVKSKFNDLYVVFIEGVSRDFKEISFRVTINNKVVKLYTNVYRVEKADTIYLKPNVEYKKIYLENIANGYRQHIEADTAEIQQHQDKIADFEQQIIEYQAAKKYQTAKEINDTNAAISILNGYIDGEKTQIKKLNDAISEYQQKIILNQQELQDLKNATE